MNGKDAKTLIAGLGSAGLCDHGFGLHIIEALRQTDLPDDVALFAGAVESELMGAIANRELVIVVDTVDLIGEPGRLVELLPEDFLDDAAQRLLYHADIRKIIALSYLMGRAPRRLKVFGIVPADCRCGNQLSESAGRQIPVVVAAVVQELKRSRSSDASADTC